MSFESDDAQRFRRLVAQRLGLHFEDGRLGLLGEVLRRRLEAVHQDAHVYLTRLEMAPTTEEIGAVAQDLTVAETYFFRNLEQFHALAQIVLPERIRAQQMRRSLRFLSAGCASGEEAYSIGIWIREHLADPGWDISVRAVDINPAVLERARRARFTAWSLRETPPELQRKWFREQGRELVLDDALRDSVRFEQRNLSHEDPELWPPETYDVVFCRNVLMYFTPESAHGVVERIERALVPGGYLFLGHAETLRGLSGDFHLCHTHGTFYYQRRHRSDGRADSVSAWEPAERLAVPPAEAAPDADTWIERIQGASERIERITSPGRHDPSPASPAAPTGPWARSDLGSALDLLVEERYAEALDRVHALPPAREGDPDALLLRAVLLTHAGRLEEAEEACARVLEIDGLNAGAHYALALCREGAGDRRRAVDHDQVAIYLDGSFAMPRLHLGLLARKGGDRETARRELGQAFVLLQREDAARVLLFGGGFRREALLELCRAELKACGGRP